MPNIRVDVGYTIHDGTEIKFRSPVDCSAITGLIVYYPGVDGNTVSKVFVLADAHGNNVGDIDHLFAEDVVVKVILDVTKGMAFVQNADTNAYLEAALAGKAPASSVGTNKVFNKLTDIGITTFPTTMKTVANSMPANSTLMLDSRDIVSGGVNEISDLGATWAGMYMFMRGNSNARFSLLHIYGATGSATSHLNYGCYAASNDSVVWLRASNTAKVKLWENAKIDSTFNAQTISLDLSGYDGVEIFYYVDSTTNIYQSTGFIKTGLPGIMYYVTASTGNRLHRNFTINTNGIKFETAVASSGATVGGLCIPYQIYGIKGVS